VLESCAELLWHGEPRPRRTAAAGEAAHESGMSAGDMRVDKTACLTCGVRTAGCSGWAREFGIGVAAPMGAGTE